MKKMSQVFALFCTISLLSFTACSPGYGCFYAASENISEETKIADVSATPEVVDSEVVNCLP